MKITPADIPDGEALVYEYGVRLDKECHDAVGEQIIKARQLYNELVAVIRLIVGELQSFVLDRAGGDAQTIQERIDALNEAFADAKARDDEPEMKRIAQERRDKWRELSEKLKSTRKELRAEIQSRFLSRIGRNSSCETYALRSQAVANGLGWATANAILEAALVSFKKSFALGRAPRFAVGADKIQDTLTLQFTAAGGVGVDMLLAGRHGELSLLPSNGCGRRKYGELRFRLGAAKAETYATGTWQYHRPLPEGASVSLARLVRRRIGKDYRYAVQLLVKREAPETLDVGERKPLVAVHFGWAADVEGRRVAGIAECADPGAAMLLRLPQSIEADLERAALIQGQRDAARDEVFQRIKTELVVPQESSETLIDEVAALTRLPAQHVALNRLHRLCRMLRDNDPSLVPDWLEQWRKEDKMRWQSHTHTAQRARNTRKDFYRKTALDLARQYDAIVLEPLDLKKAAQKVDKSTGEKTEFTRRARSGRVVAALYEFESSIKWAATKAGTAVLELSGKTATHCSLCGDTIHSDDENPQVLNCTHCGAVLDRKLNGAAVAWQTVCNAREEAVAEFWLFLREAQERKREEKATKLSKMMAGRNKARASNHSDAA